MGKIYAMMLSTTEDLYQEEIWTSLSDYVEEGEDRVYFFCGKPIASTYDDEMYSNIIFNLMGHLPMDGLISLTGSLNYYVGPEAYKEYLEQFEDIPKVSISVPIEGCSNVLLDNYTSSHELCEHLIDHDYKRFGILSGPDRTPESKQRIDGTLAALSKHGITDPIILSGDFTKKSGHRLANQLIDAHVDVIVCANDLMALGAYQAISERGLRMPIDIAVVGFDDIEQSRLIDVPITTVKQPFDTMVKMAYDILKNGRVETLNLKGEVKLRASCGCYEDIIDLKNEQFKKQHYMNKYHESIQEYNQTIHMHNVFDQVNTLGKLNDAIHDYLTESEGIEFHLCLFENGKQIIQDPMTFKFPVTMSHQFGYIDGKRYESSIYSTADGLPQYAFQKSSSRAFLVYPVNHHNVSYGYIVADAKTARSKTFTALRREITNALSRIDMYSQIKQYSQQMAQLASMDTMTGMLNRRGFFSFVKVDFEAQLRQAKAPGIIFCDVNGLKKVNDNHGHAYGDRMIVHTSNILKKVFKNDTVARLGGDEFIIYKSDCSGTRPEHIYDALHHEIASFNQESEEPYRLSLEAGMATFEKDKHRNLDDLISHADKMLYLKKGKCR